MTIYRPGFYNIHVGGGVRIEQPMYSAAAPANWWLSGGIAAANCLAAYTPKGAASLAVSYDNNAAPGNGLPDGTYDAAPGTAPGWDAVNGWKFVAASTQYLTTGIVPADAYSVVIRYASAPAATQVIMGCAKTAAPSGGYYFIPMNGGGASCQHANGIYGVSVANVVPGQATAVIATAAKKTFLNGNLTIWTIVAGAGAYGAFGFYIGTYNLDGAPGGLWFGGNIQAIAIYGATITNAQVLAVSTAMAAL